MPELLSGAVFVGILTSLAAIMLRARAPKPRLSAFNVILTGVPGGLCHPAGACFPERRMAHHALAARPAGHHFGTAFYRGMGKFRRTFYWQPSGPAAACADLGRTAGRRCNGCPAATVSGLGNRQLSAGLAARACQARRPQGIDRIEAAQNCSPQGQPKDREPLSLIRQCGGATVPALSLARTGRRLADWLSVRSWFFSLRT